MTGDERGGEDVEAIVDVEAMAAVDLSPKHPRLISPRTHRISPRTRPGQRTTPMVVLAKLLHGVLHS